MHEWSLIILAAGKGTRLNSSIPKPLVELGGKPLIQPIIEHGLNFVFSKIIVVISSYTADIPLRFTDPRLTYLKTAPLGTGHCAEVALALVDTENVIIAQADDSYFYREATLRHLQATHEAAKAQFTLGIVHTELPSVYSSVETAADGRLLRLHRTTADLRILPPKDIVAGLYAAQAQWLRERLSEVGPNHQGERGLPSVVDIGLQRNEAIFTASIPSGEWQGINTQQELIAAQELLSKNLLED